MNGAKLGRDEPRVQAQFQHSLPIKGAGEGAYKFGGLAAMLGTAVAGKKGIGIGELGRGVSVPCWEGNQLSSNVTSLNNLTKQVCLSYS